MYRGKKALAYFPTEDKWCKLRDTAFDYQSHCLVQWKDKIHIFCEDCNTVGESEAFRQHYQPNINSWGSIQSDQIKSINRCIIFKGDLYLLSFKMNSEKKMYSYDATVLVASDQYLFIIGGLSEARQVLSRSKRFHPTHNTWEDNGKVNEARHSAFGAAMNGHVYIAGGMTNRGNQGLSSCEMYSALSNEWQLIACLNSPRCNASMVCLEGKLYVLGGRCSSRNPIIHISRVLTIEELDSESRGWTVKSVVLVDKFETLD